MPVTRSQFPLLIESLESRMLLSAGTGLSATQLHTLYNTGKADLHHAAAKNPTVKLSSDLASLYQKQVSGTAITSADFLYINATNGEPSVNIRVTGPLKPMVKKLEKKFGFTLQSLNAKLKVIEGLLPIASLAKVAAIPAVKTIQSISKPIVLDTPTTLSPGDVGAAPNQAYQVMRADIATTLYGVDGTGISIGVLSDSVSQYQGGLADSIASGDLPSDVTDLMDGPAGATDEGRAMLEEIHDMVPGAKLFFYTADDGQQAFADGITQLQQHGCQVICDDIHYGDEPFFQDGVISQAINAFVKSGGTYLSAAGNDTNNGYLNTNGLYTTNALNQPVFNFGTAQNPQASLNFTVAELQGVDTGIGITLGWDEPYNGVTGQASTELDLYIYNQDGTLNQVANAATLTSGIPLQSLELGAGNYSMQIVVAAMAPGGHLPDMIKFTGSADGGEALTGITADPSMGTYLSNTSGHNAGQYTVSVGAVSFSSAPPFSSVVPILNEPYSSTGPVDYTFDPNGIRLATPLQLDKPTISGVDAINTSFFGDRLPNDPTTLPQFSGTSAATPNVASIVAMIDEFHPGSTEQEIVNALEASATPLNGAAAGTWDPKGGYGLVDAVNALNYFGAPTTGLSVKIAPIASPHNGSISSDTITFSQPVTGFTLANLSLTLNGGSNLLTGDQTLTTTDNQTYTLGNLDSITTAFPTDTANPVAMYTLTLNKSGIVSNATPLSLGASISWANYGPFVPTVTLLPVATPQTTAVSAETISFNVTVTGFSLANISLTLNGGPNLITSAQTLTTTDNATFTLGNLGAITALAGNYVLTVSVAGVTTNGVAIANGASINWTTVASVTNEYVFYNDSSFDGNDPAANAADDNAIATDKTALLPGHTATAANYTSYVNGINGIMIDIGGIGANNITASDFTFFAGNTSIVGQFTSTFAPQTVLVRPGAGVNGETRVEMIWANGAAVKKQWLQVTVLADANTGLTTPFVFYFGNAVGDTLDSLSNAQVNGSDISNVQQNESPNPVPITNPYDFNRDGFVTGADVAIAQANQTSSANLSALELITPH